MNQTINKKFVTFNKNNPSIYVTFKMLSYRAKARGFKRYGAWAIFNVVRWEIDMHTYGNKFKINNNFIALYSRKLIKEDVSFKKFFNIRSMKNA